MAQAQTAPIDSLKVGDHVTSKVPSNGLHGSRQLRNARGRYLPRCLDAVRAVGRNLRRARMMAFHEGMTPGTSNVEESSPNDGSGPDGRRGSLEDCSVPLAEMLVVGVVCSDIPLGI
jgi:hypothetical protein